ncbi:MAG TPA: HAD-IIA family hydrolase [Kineosporiaceae bacterium]|nr:HAD-IIA family hydrolase [Kineosporiaceae bacterium]
MSVGRRIVLRPSAPPATVFDVALLDLDGVVYVGPDAVPGAAQAIAEAARRGLHSVYVTNNASRPPGVVADQLRRLEIPAGDGDVVTSAQLAAGILAGRLPPGAAVLVVGGAGLHEALTEEGLRPVTSMDDDPQAVVQGFAPEIGWRDLAEGARAVRAGLLWVATNLDLTVPTTHGPAPGNGTLVAAVAAAGGRPPDEVAGKPVPRAFSDAARRAGGRRPLVVGDRLDTDMEGARAAGLPGLLVLTGVTGVTELLAAGPEAHPDLVGHDLGALLEYHPEASAGPDGSGRCRDAAVSVRGGGFVVEDPGRDVVDLLRAACAAAWTAPAVLDPQPVVDAVHALEPGAPWAR